MQEMDGNLWDFYGLSEQHIACITTNGFVKTNGECVMGRGCAREARDKFPGLAELVGSIIKSVGNHVYWFMNDGNKRIATFPTKHNWWEKSDIELIQQSAGELGRIAGRYPDHIFYLPRPGCGNGQLTWDDVKPAIKDLLPDNVIVVNYAQADAK